MNFGFWRKTDALSHRKFGSFLHRLLLCATRTSLLFLLLKELGLDGVVLHCAFCSEDREESERQYGAIGVQETGQRIEQLRGDSGKAERATRIRAQAIGSTTTQNS